MRYVVKTTNGRTHSIEADEYEISDNTLRFYEKTARGRILVKGFSMFTIEYWGPE